MSEFSQPHVVWYGISSILTKIREDIAILRVYRLACAKLQNRFLEKSYIVIMNHLFLEITKIFDPAYCGKDENCSIKLLRELCKKSEHKFPDKEQDPLLQRVNDLCNDYENMYLKRLRNKKLSHYDLASMFDHTFSQVNFDEIVKLVEEYTVVISEIGERLLGIRSKFSEITDLEKEYEDSLKTLMSK